MRRLTLIHIFALVLIAIAAPIRVQTTKNAHIHLLSTPTLNPRELNHVIPFYGIRCQLKHDERWTYFTCMEDGVKKTYKYIIPKVFPEEQPKVLEDIGKGSIQIQHQGETTQHKLQAVQQTNTNQESTTTPDNNGVEGISHGIGKSNPKEGSALNASEEKLVGGSNVCLVPVGNNSLVAGLGAFAERVFKLLAQDTARIWADLNRNVGAYLGKMFKSSGIGSESSYQVLKEPYQNRKDREELMRNDEAKNEVDAGQLLGKPIIAELGNRKKVLTNGQISGELIEKKRKVYRRAAEEGKKMLGRPIQFDPQGNYIDGGVLDSIMGIWTREADGR